MKNTAMKLKDDLILREVAGQYVIVPVGKRVQEIPTLVYVTETAAYLWEYMTTHDFEMEDLVELILKKYDVERETVQNDMKNFIKKLSDYYLLDDGKVRGRIFVENKKGM